MPAVIPLQILNQLSAEQEEFRPGAHTLWVNENFSVLLLVGPNPRDDYHVNPGSEVYYQLKGDIVVVYFDAEGKRQEQPVKEGEVWLLEAGAPHQPYRPKGTVGLVVEHAPGPNEVSKVAWYCRNCDALLRELAMSEAYGSRESDDGAWRTCKRCGSTLTRPEAVAANP
jgi:3-hydroxyanthranilate 3,4-dioxygenase